ncbi:hypothetical protein GW17_00019944 [Ensete ventricosum]|nr:hypothetical protein GW17_00019944 [Ensete ventricosum]
MSREGQDHAEVWSGATRSSTLVYDTIRRRAMDSRSECHSTAEVGLRMIRAVGELDCFSAHIRLREPDKSEDKADKASVRKEVDSEERHCAAEADLPIAKEGT